MTDQREEAVDSTGLSEDLRLFQTRDFRAQSVLPTDNDWGVPCLDPAMQPSEVELPVLLWGERKGVINHGTWAFYVDDVAFRKARHDPAVLVRTRCHSTTELNLSVFEQTPRAIALAHTYEKRMMASRWQALGVRVFVDICVPAVHRDICMLGVPQGWRAFSTRAWASRIDELRDEYAFAERWANGRPLLLVVGGGERAREECLRLPGAIWFPGYEPRKRKAADGEG